MSSSRRGQSRIDSGVAGNKKKVAARNALKRKCRSHTPATMIFAKALKVINGTEDLDLLDAFSKNASDKVKRAVEKRLNSLGDAQKRREEIEAAFPETVAAYTAVAQATDDGDYSLDDGCLEVVSEDALKVKRSLAAKKAAETRRRNKAAKVA